MSLVYSTNRSKSLFNDEKKEKKSPQPEVIHCYLPPLLSEEAIGSALGEFDSPKMRVNVLMFYTYLNKVFYNSVEKNAGTWVGVHRDDRRTILGKDYRIIIDQLIAHDLLERRDYNKDGRFFPAGYCRYGKDGLTKSYRAPLHLLGQNQPWRHETRDLTQLLRNKLRDLAGRKQATMEEYRALTATNMSLLILVDTPASRAAIEALFARHNHRVSAEQFIHIFNNYPFSAPIVDEFGGRLHHEVVRLHKSLRPFLRFRDHQDQEVVELDLVASQPSFLANITPALIRKYAPECGDAIPYFEKYNQRSDYQEYQRLCQEGMIYEHLRDKFNERYSSSLATLVTRDDAKNIYYNAAFSNYKFREKMDNPDSSVKTETRLLRYQLSGNEEGARKASATLFKKRSYSLFKSLFPSLHELFTDLKSLTWEFNQGKQHANNCLLAQRIESGIVYTHLVKALVDCGIERFTTTHDSLNVMKTDEKLARKAVTKALKQAGLKMNLKTKDKQKPVLPVVETAPEIEPTDATWEPTIPFIAGLDDYEIPVAPAAPQIAPATHSTGLSDDEIVRRMAEIEAGLPQISAEEFFGL